MYMSNTITSIIFQENVEIYRPMSQVNRGDDIYLI